MKSRILLCLTLLVAVIGMGLTSCTPAGAVTLNPALPFQSVVLSQTPQANTPAINGNNSQAVVEVGTRVIVGGNFTSVKNWNTPTTYNRTNIMAYNKSTGVVDQTFNPTLDGQVTALLNAGNGMIYVAGQFQHVNGLSAPFLVRMNATTGALDTTFKPNPDGMVYDIRQVDNVIYLGGTFAQMNNQPRSNFAAVDATTGALLPVDVPFQAAVTGITRVVRMAISPDGSTLVAIGNFTTAGGLTRQNIAKLDLNGGTSATVDNWSTDLYRSGTCSSSYDSSIRDVAFSPDGTYFVVGGTGAYFGTVTLCDAVARWENNSASPAQTTWRDYTGGDSIGSVAATGGVVYTCGHMRWANNNIPPHGDTNGTGSVDRVGIAAYDSATGSPIAWNPSRERGLDCFRMTPTNDGMYILSDSSNFGTTYHPHLTFLTVAGGTTPATSTYANLPVNLQYSGSTVTNLASDTLNQRPYDGTTLGTETAVASTGTAWSQVRGVVKATNGTYEFLANGSVLVSTDGTTWTTVPEWITFSNLGSMAFGGMGTGISNAGTLYYTIRGDSRLFARGFSTDSQIISTLLHTISGSSIDGVNWSDTVGLTVIGGELYHTHSDGTLRRTDLANGLPVAASTVVISGPAKDGLNWSHTTALQTTPGTVVPPSTTTTTSTSTTTSTTTTLPTTTTTTAPTTTTSTTAPTTTTTAPTPSPIFTDGFDTGLSNWTNISGLTVDTVNGAPTGTAPSVLATANGSRASGQRSFTPSHAQVCAAVSVKETSLTGNTNIMRIRTTTMSVGRLYVTSAGALWIRSDAAGTQKATGASITLGTWNRLQLCVATGPTGSISLTVNGTAAGTPLAANNGTTSLSIMEIGDANVNTWTGSFDDVALTDPTGA